MSETQVPQIKAELDPDTSRALFLAVEKRRRARGWSRAKLAQIAGCMSVDALNMLHFRTKKGIVTRVELSNALALLAAVDIASNHVDELVAQLANGVASLIEEAADVPEAAS